MPARRGRSVDVGHGIAATGSAGLVEADGVFTEPVGANEGISSARPGVFWGGVPVRGRDIARGLGCGGGGDRGKGDIDKDSGEKVLSHGGSSLSAGVEMESDAKEHARASVKSARKFVGVFDGREVRFPHDPQSGQRASDPPPTHGSLEWDGRGHGRGIGQGQWRLRSC
jgi:hypothetical protein